MDMRLYQASLSGEVDTLDRLIQEDPLILDKVTVGCLDGTPLHIAALLGHLEFTRALLHRKPNFATELDSSRRSPLHLASDKGHVDIVRELLHAKADVCLYRDKDRRIPLHLAVMKGRVEVIQELIQHQPDSTMETLYQGETVLHLCVRSNSLGALKLLVESVHGDELVNSTDDGGNTILHVAATYQQMEIIKYLLSRTCVKEKANAVNRNDFTALDVLEHCPRDLNGLEIRCILLEAGVRRRGNLRPSANNISETENPTTQTRSKLRQFLSNFWKKYKETDANWMNEARANGNLILAATVMATMAFQAGINPPGGVWQENKLPKENKKDLDEHTYHFAGTSVLATLLPTAHKVFLLCNTVSFVASVSIILLLISGFPLKKKLPLWLLMIPLSVAVISMGFTFYVSIRMITFSENWKTLKSIHVGAKLVDGINISVIITGVGVLVFVILLYATRILTGLVDKLRKLNIKWRPAIPANDSAVSV